MITYYDLESLSDIEINENTVLYLIKIDEQHFAIKAHSSNIISSLTSDPDTRAKRFWRILCTRLPTDPDSAAFKQLFSIEMDNEGHINNKLRTSLLTRQEINSYLNLNPINDKQEAVEQIANSTLLQVGYETFPLPSRQQAIPYQEERLPPNIFSRLKETLSSYAYLIWTLLSIAVTEDREQPHHHFFQTLQDRMLEMQNDLDLFLSDEGQRQPENPSLLVRFGLYREPQNRNFQELPPVTDNHLGL